MAYRFFFLSLTILFFSLKINAQTENCPRGRMYECTGLCGFFTDQNNDGFCDYSIVEEKLKTDSIAAGMIDTEEPQQQENQAVTNIVNTTNDTVIKDSVKVEKIEVDNKKTSIKPPIKKDLRPRYPLTFISLLTLIPYFISSLLVKTKTIKKRIHRKIWNYILLITFTVAGILGLILVIQINYKIMMNLFLENLKLHVEFGISMAIISIIHVIWHWNYYFSRKKQKEESL